jgi:hypothetical protein
MEQVLACSEVTQHLSFVAVPTGVVYTANLDVFPVPVSERNGYFAAMQSSVHDGWARFHSSHLENRLKYSPGNALETFPFPDALTGLDDIGERYYNCRQTIMQTRQEGLTKTYNRFHDPDDTSPDIAELRRLHIELDQAVAAAYGWENLDLGHGFHDTKQGLRYTLSEPARREVLDRLLRLNHERYDQEVAEGLHDKPGKQAATTKKKTTARGKRKSTTDHQNSLF